MSVSLRYRDGVFVQGLTRGDGITSGEDVTLNLRRVIGIVERLVYPAPDLELRGEVYLPIERFHAINAALEAQDQKTFANPRNCAAGTLRQLDSDVVAERGLACFIFNLQFSADPVFRDSEVPAWLAEQGFTVSPVIGFAKRLMRSGRQLKHP